IRWYARSERMVFPFAMPVDTTVDHPRSAHQCPAMKMQARKIPPARPAITIAPPTVSHQIQKYGFATLVTKPAKNGLVVTTDAGLLLPTSETCRLPARVRMPKRIRATPP